MGYRRNFEKYLKKSSLIKIKVPIIIQTMSSKSVGKKTNAMRILESAHIEYSVLSYDDDGEHELEKGAAVKTAEKLGVDPEAVFKTIVMKTDSGEICVFCVPAALEVNLKKARTVAGAKDIEPVKQDKLNALTGYVRGGCSPLGMKRSYRTFFDESIILQEKVYVSAGVRGVQLCLNAEDLVAVCKGIVCSVATEI